MYQLCSQSQAAKPGSISLWPTAFLDYIGKKITINDKK